MGFIRNITGIAEQAPGPIAQLSCQEEYYDRMRRVWVNVYGEAENRWDLLKGPAMGPYREHAVKLGLKKPLGGDCRGCGAPYEPVCSYCKRNNLA